MITTLLAVAAWCSDTRIIPPALPTATGVQVYYDDRVALNYTLTSTTPRPDGTYGINVAIDYAIRAMRTSINMINADVSADLPPLAYVGPYTSPTTPATPSTSVVISSPPTATFNTYCGATAMSCVLPGTATTASFILLRPTNSTATWKTTRGVVDVDVVATMTHNFFRLFGLRQSELPGSAACPLTGVAPYDEISTDGAVTPRSIMNRSAGFTRNSRWIYRDDIEGLRDVWGARVVVSAAQRQATDPAGAWTNQTDVLGTAAVRSAASASSAYASPDDTIIALAYSAMGERVHVAYRKESSDWGQDMVEVGPAGATFSKPSVAYGDGKLFVVWIDESDKSTSGANAGYPRVR